MAENFNAKFYTPIIRVSFNLKFSFKLFSKQKIKSTTFAVMQEY